MKSTAQIAGLLLIGAVAAVMFPQSGRGGEPRNRLDHGAVRPAVIGDDGGGGPGGFQVGGGWYPFNCPSSVCEPIQVPFTFRSESQVTVVVTDAWVNGDQFEVFDSGVSLGQTSAPGDDGRTAPDDPCAALIDPAWTSGVFTLGPGDHSITIKVLRFASGWSEGGGYLRADLGSLTDTDGDQIPDICDLCVGPGSDSDGDGICDGADDCPFTFNPGQEDGDGDGTGDVCEPPPDDNFAGAIALSGGDMPYNDSLNNPGATLEAGEPQPCVPIGGTVWYSFTPSSDTVIEVNTSGSTFDTVLAAYSGSSLGDLVLITCNDDAYGPSGPSMITLPVSAGQTVFIQAGGYGQVGGYRENRGSLVFNMVSESSPLCVGDCDAHGQVTVDEILTLVNIALGNTEVTECSAGDANSDDVITIDEILTAVDNALSGCGS
jgi:hypothetical protein